MFISILFFIVFYVLSSKEDQKVLDVAIVIAIAIGILLVAFGPRPANATATKFSCYKAFQNASRKQERTIKHILHNCEIAPRANFDGDEVYAEHLEALYYFVQKTYNKNKFVFANETNKKLTLLLNKINKLHLCHKGHKEECPVKKSLKKKPTLDELEIKMERACERDNNSFACKFYYRKILNKLDESDFSNTEETLSFKLAGVAAGLNSIVFIPFVIFLIPFFCLGGLSLPREIDISLRKKNDNNLKLLSFFLKKKNLDINRRRNKNLIGL
tara:strand:- start:17777 stop:18592 length:816 start_codon:yes stop_codon:yes gene_type:complete